MHDWLNLYVILAALGCAMSALFTGVLIALAPRLGLVDEPGAEKFHRRTTPVGGGIAIFAALLPILAFAQTRYSLTYLILAGSGFLALVGLVDDLRHVPATLKFALLVALTSILWLFGVGAHPTSIRPLDFAITVLWTTGIASAFNAIDNMDGLASGVAAIAGLAFVVVALDTRQWVLGALSAALVGGTLGFLLWNFHPARIFMGDTGSFFLGFFLATLGMLGEWNSNHVIAASIPVLVLGLPIFDLAFTVLRRHQTGVTRTVAEAIRHCATDHLSHRLVRLGLEVPKAVLFLYLIAGSFAISAVTLRVARSVDAALHLLQAVVIVAACIPLLILAESRPPHHAAASGPPERTRRLPWLVAAAALLLAVAAAYR